MGSCSTLICEVCSLAKIGVFLLERRFASSPKWTCTYLSLVWTSCVNSLIIFNLVPLQDSQNPLTRFYRANCPLSKKVAFSVSNLLVYLLMCVMNESKQIRSISTFEKRLNMCSSFSQVFFQSCVYSYCLLLTLLWFLSSISEFVCSSNPLQADLFDCFCSGIFSCPSPFSFKIHFLVVAVDWVVSHIVFCS